MQDKVGLVTGGGSGIGRASALMLAAAGAIVCVIDLDEAGAAGVAMEIAEAGGRAWPLAADATDERQIADAVARITERHGRLDWALNNVGRGEPGQTILSTTGAGWDRILEVSLKSTWLAMKHEIPPMQAAGGGVIVNMASIAGLVARAASSPAYAAAKAGVIHLTRYAASAHAADGIRVNAVAPGLTVTPLVQRWFTPDDLAASTARDQLIGRPTTPDEVAAVVLFLCSPAAAMITGSVIPVSGGTP